MKTPTTGILIVALGKRQYGQMAAALARSLWTQWPDAPIALVHAGQALSGLDPADRAQLAYCIHALDYEAGVSATKPPDYPRVKTELLARSPFHRTLYLDADTLWCPDRPTQDLLAELAGLPLAVPLYGSVDLQLPEPALQAAAQALPYTFWADIQEIKRHFPEAKSLPQCSTTMLYFERSAATAALFETVQAVYAEPRAKVLAWGNGLPDEYAFNVALALHPNLLAQQQARLPTPYLPIWWHGQAENASAAALPAAESLLEAAICGPHWALTTGGHRVPRSVAKLYNQWCQTHARALRRATPFRHTDKRHFLPERQAF